MFSNSASHEHYRTAIRRHGQDQTNAAAQRQSALLGRLPDRITQLRKLLGAALIAAGIRLSPEPGHGRGIRPAAG